MKNALYNNCHVLWTDNIKTDILKKPVSQTAESSCNPPTVYKNAPLSCVVHIQCNTENSYNIPCFDYDDQGCDML
jgi:hypothetical protein